MTTSDAHVKATSAVRRAEAGIPLNPRVHGRARVPGQPARDFDLAAFARALEAGDAHYLLASYALDADVRIVDPDNPSTGPRLVQGTAAIKIWLLESFARKLDVRVTELVDGGNRVAFTERWHYSDGARAVSTSTAELDDGLITTQHTLLVWDQA